MTAIKLIFTFLPFFVHSIEHSAEKFNFKNHSYVCFDGQFFLHDPECGCDCVWNGWFKTSPDDITFITLMRPHD